MGKERELSESYLNHKRNLFLDDDYDLYEFNRKNELDEEYSSSNASRLSDLEKANLSLEMIQRRKRSDSVISSGRNSIVATSKTISCPPRVKKNSSHCIDIMSHSDTDELFNVELFDSIRSRSFRVGESSARKYTMNPSIGVKSKSNILPTSRPSFLRVAQNSADNLDERSDTDDLFNIDSFSSKNKIETNEYTAKTSFLNKLQEMSKIASKYFFSESIKTTTKENNDDSDKIKRYFLLFTLINMSWTLGWFFYISSSGIGLNELIKDRTKPTLSSDIIRYATQISGYDAISDTSSPQYHALKWLKESDMYTFNSFIEMSERYILTTFYFSTQGPSWKMNSWLTSEPTCSWYGITCQQLSNGYVLSSISLPLMGLKGTIPSEIGYLAQLAKVILFSNELVGTIPNSLTRLLNLEKLNLKNNSLQGTIPVEWNFMSSLRTIDISLNSIEGPIPYSISALLNLDGIFFQRNKLDGQVPFMQLFNLKKLRVLNLSHNSLSGKIPSDGMEVFKHLQYLSLRYNMFFGELPSKIGHQLPNLKTLKLDHNEFYGNLPDSLGEMHHLEDVQLESNSFEGKISGSFCNLTQIYKFTSDCKNNLFVSCECCTECF